MNSFREHLLLLKFWELGWFACDCASLRAGVCLLTSGCSVWKVVTGEAGKLVDDDDEQKKAVVRTEKSQIEKWKVWDVLMCCLTVTV